MYTGTHNNYVERLMSSTTNVSAFCEALGSGWRRGRRAKAARVAWENNEITDFCSFLDLYRIIMFPSVVQISLWV